MRIIRVTGLVVFFTAVFLTFVGSNQLVVDNKKNEAVPAKGAIDNITVNAPAPTVDSAQDTATEIANSVEGAKRNDGGGRSPKPFQRRSTEYGVWRDHKGGKWAVTREWDGTKWVSKRIYYPFNKE